LLLLLFKPFMALLAFMCASFVELLLKELTGTTVAVFWASLKISAAA
jgi:hypothetical protein